MIAEHWISFALVYNDVLKYPKLADIAVGLNCSYQTVRNKASVLRKMGELDVTAPQIIRRDNRATEALKDEKLEISASEHANNRASSLEAQVKHLVSNTRYPLVNPDAIIIKGHTKRIYDRQTLKYREIESTPHVWLRDTLRVEPVVSSKGRRFIFAGAQNDTEIHEEFWINIQAYAEHLDADIVIGPWTYETQWWSENNDNARSYDSRIMEYLCFGQMLIGDNFVFCGEMNTLPTASRPISDLTTYSRGRWAVFPHAKLQLKSVPSTNPDKQAHQVMSSGAVTRPTVIARKAGIKSIFHHVIGATLVEFDDEGDIFCRQLNADDQGNFQDLNCLVKDGVVHTGQTVRVLVAGDAHVRKINDQNARVVFGIDLKGNTRLETSMLDALGPDHLFLHDVFDNETRNHHNSGDTAHSYEMAYAETDNVMDEIRQVGDFLNLVQNGKVKVHVVESNHDLGLERYVREGRYRNDGKNIRLGLQLEDAYLAHREKQVDQGRAGEKRTSFSLLEHALRQVVGPDIKDVSWVHDGKSFPVDEIECGHHGFRGANGSRGTITGFAAMGRKMSIGDKHSPEIMDGVYCAGTMQLHMGYNKGPSGWAVSCIVQYASGKRTLVTLQNGKWRA